MTDSNDPQPQEDRLHDAVINELRESERVPFQIPAERTENILRDAREYLASERVVRPPRHWLRMTAAIGSVCAALLLFLVPRFMDQDHRTKRFAEVVPETDLLSPRSRDIDGNGTVDILDAYAMARGIQSGESGDQWDFTSDGQLNEDDVRLVALDAVML